MVESERWASASGATTAGHQPGIRDRESADREPEPGDHELDAQARGGEEPGLADAVPAAEVQHDPQQEVIDEDEDPRRSQARKSEAELAVLTDRVDREPGRKAAEGEVRDVERLDVPRVAVADRERDVERDHEGHDEEWRQDERTRDDEGRPGMKAVVPADRDAEQRCDRGERKQDGKGPPLGRGGRISENCEGGRDDRGKGDDGA